MSATGQKRPTSSNHVRFPLIVLQKSFCTGIKNAVGKARLSRKDVRGPHRSRKPSGDFGNAIEIIRIVDRFPLHVVTKNPVIPATFDCRTQSAIRDISRRSNLRVYSMAAETCFSSLLADTVATLVPDRQHPGAHEPSIRLAVGQTP